MSEQAEQSEDLYREVILEHARKPRNFGRLETATHSAEGINPLCGDKLRLYLRIDSDKQIVDIGFEGSGCAISMASASLLTEALKNVSTLNARAFADAITDRLTEKSSSASALVDLSALRALDGVRQHPSRVKCATLAWQALYAALDNSSQTATTE